MKIITLIIAIIISLSVVNAQTSRLPIALTNVAHYYPNMTAVTASGSLNYSNTRLTAREVTFQNDPIILTKGFINADDINFGGIANVVTINTTAINANNDITIHSKEIFLNALTVKAQTITLTNPTVKIKIKGDVKWICDEINFGAGTITIESDPAGGTLTIKCKRSIGTGYIIYDGKVNVHFESR